MSKQVAGVLVIAVLVGAVLGASFAGRSDSANAGPMATTSDVVTQLKRLNTRVASVDSQLKTLNSRIGDTQTSQGSVRSLLTIICDYTASISCKP